MNRRPSRTLAAIVSAAALAPIVFSGASADAAPTATTRTTVAKAVHAKKIATKKTTTKKTTTNTPAAEKVAKRVVAKKPAPQGAARRNSLAPATAVFLERSTAGQSAVKDAAGNVWKPRTVGWGTWNRSDGLAGRPIAGTNDDALYRANAWGIKGYHLDVPARATYAVRLLMAEDFFSAPGGRVFDIVAEGKTVAAGVDIAKAAGGKATAYTLTVNVPVTDGRLDLAFVARTNNPLISAIEVRSTTPVALPVAPTGTPVTISPTSALRTRIDSAPTAANSARTIALLTRDVTDNWNGNAAFNAYSYDSPVYKVGAGQKKIRVAFDDCQKKGYLPANLLTGKAQFVDVPVPDNAVPGTGTDGAMTIWDPSADKVWEFWQMRRQGAGWKACWGGRIDRVSASQGVFDAPYGSTASGIMLGATMVTADEIRRGRIDHAIALAAPTIGRWDRFSWPANRSDGNSADSDAVMEGQRLRLDPRLDVDSLDLTPVGKIVAKAAQQYGFVVVDKSGAVSVIAESGEPERARTGTNPWDVLLGDASHRALRGFPWQRLQALPKDYGKR